MLIKAGKQLVTSWFGDDEASTSQVEKPEENREKANEQAAASRTYPPELATEDNPHPNFLVFRAMNIIGSSNQAYRQTRKSLSSNQSISHEILTTINLYMPAMQETIAQNWDTSQFSLVGDILADVVTNGIGEGTMARTGGAILGAAERAVAGKFNDQAQQQTGELLTPNVIGSYQGPERRQQTLQFTFNPKSKDELVAVSNIIRDFYRGSLPTFSGNTAISRVYQPTGAAAEGRANALQSYLIPPVWHIEEISTSEAERYTPRFVFGPAALTNISLNRTPDQYWKTFKDTAGDAATIEIELTFSELFPVDTSIWDEDQKGIKGGYNPGGNES